MDLDSFFDFFYYPVPIDGSDYRNNYYWKTMNNKNKEFQMAIDSFRVDLNAEVIPELITTLSILVQSTDFHSMYTELNQFTLITCMFFEKIGYSRLITI